MLSNISGNDRQSVTNYNPLVELPLFITKLRNSIWTFGIPSWLFGITDRSIAALADSYLSAIEIVHLLTASLFFMGWLYLRPEDSWHSSSLDELPSTESDATLHFPEEYLCAAQARMIELKEQHMISQDYILPFPYLCQIYHLLNLRHLETIHNFSLNNLRVIKVKQFHQTLIGGTIKFQTFLDSPFNVLRIWRPPIVEVGLSLHTPYTVELNIPVYNDKHIIVIFNVLPLSPTEHKLSIDIYSNLEWPKPLLQALLHFASCLTLFEDLPYLRKLAEKNIERLFSVSRVSNHETMLLFRRFVDLYGAGIKPSQPIQALDASC